MKTLAALIGLLGILFLTTLYLATRPDDVSSGDSAELSSDDSLLLERDLQERTRTPSNIPVTQETGGEPSVLSHKMSKDVVQTITDNSTSISNDNEYLVSENDLYSIYFISHAQHIAIQIHTYPYDLAQAQAQDFLTDLLNISPEQLCAYHVDVYMPDEIDPRKETDLGLPTCPGPRKAYIP